MATLLLKDQLCFQVYSAARLFTQAYAPMLKELDLTYPQYLTMMVLWEKDQISVKDLGEKLKLDSGTLSPLIKKLESKGYVERSRLPFDERVVCLTLTAQGKALKKAAKNIPEQMACQTAMPFKDLMLLKEMLEQLNSNLEQSL